MLPLIWCRHIYVLLLESCWQGLDLVSRLPKEIVLIRKSNAVWSWVSSEPKAANSWCIIVATRWHRKRMYNARIAAWDISLPKVYCCKTIAREHDWSTDQILSLLDILAAIRMAVARSMVYLVVQPFQINPFRSRSRCLCDTLQVWDLRTAPTLY